MGSEMCIRDSSAPPDLAAFQGPTSKGRERRGGNPQCFISQIWTLCMCKCVQCQCVLLCRQISHFLRHFSVHSLLMIMMIRRREMAMMMMMMRMMPSYRGRETSLSFSKSFVSFHRHFLHRTETASSRYVAHSCHTLGCRSVSVSLTNRISVCVLLTNHKSVC